MQCCRSCRASRCSDASRKGIPSAVASNVDAIVVGGGVIGLTVARQLAMGGRRVSLLERTELGRETSWAGAGIIAPCNPHRDDPVARLTDRSIELYAEFCASLHAETGVDPEYDRNGAFEMLLTEQDRRIAESDARAAASRSSPDASPAMSMLTPVEARAREPHLAEDVVGVLECHRTALVRNPRLLTALKRSCECHHVALMEHAPARSLLIEGDRVLGVQLEDRRMEAPTVILCAGAWSSALHPRLAQLLPVHPVRGQMVLVCLDQPLVGRLIGKGRRYIVPRRDGHLLIGSTEEPDAGFERRCTPKGINTLIETAIRLVPELQNAPVQATWSGLRPGSPDDKPFIGPVPGFRGLFAATGHYRAGLTLAPVTADIVNALVDGKPYELDLTPCAPGRAFPNRSAG